MPPVKPVHVAAGSIRRGSPLHLRDAQIRMYEPGAASRSETSARDCCFGLTTGSRESVSQRPRSRRSRVGADDARRLARLRGRRGFSDEPRALLEVVRKDAGTNPTVLELEFAPNPASGATSHATRLTGAPPSSAIDLLERIISSAARSRLPVISGTLVKHARLLDSCCVVGFPNDRGAARSPRLSRCGRSRSFSG